MVIWLYLYNRAGGGLIDAILQVMGWVGLVRCGIVQVDGWV